MKNIFINTFINYSKNYQGFSKECWQGIFLTFLNDASASVIFFLSLYFVKDFKMSISLATSIISFYGIGLALGGIVGGKLSDLISPRFVMITSLLLKIVVLLLFAFIGNLFLLFLNCFLIGVIDYCFKTANKTNTLQNCDKESKRLRLIGVMYVASNLGVGLATLLIGYIELYSFKAVFFFSGCLALSALLLLFLFSQDRKFKTKINNHLKKTTVNEHKSSNGRLVVLALFCLFIIGLTVSQLFATYGIFIHNQFPSYGTKGVGILLSINSILIIILQAPLLKTFGSFNKLVLMGFGGLLFGLGLTILNFSYVFPIAILSCIVETVGEMLFMSTSQSVVYENSSSIKKGRNLGLYQSTYAISIIIGPFLGGHIYDDFGSNVLWYSCGVLGLICLLACSFAKRKVQKNRLSTIT